MSFRYILENESEQPVLGWNMSKKKVMNLVKNKAIEQYQVGYMYYPGSNQNNAFKYHVGRSMRLKFDKK